MHTETQLLPLVIKQEEMRGGGGGGGAFCDGRISCQTAGQVLVRDDGTGGPITAPAFIKCLCVNGRLQTESEEGESLKKHPTLPMQSSSNRLANIIYHGEK